MSELYLIVRLGGERVAFSAADVESVIEIEAIVPVPRAAAHVAGLAAMRSRVLTVIDCHASLDPANRHGERREAVVTVVDGHPYALLVDGVDDVVEAEGEVRQLRSSAQQAWSRVARGLVSAEGDLFLLVDVASLIAGPSAQAA